MNSETQVEEHPIVDRCEVCTRLLAADSSAPEGIVHRDAAGDVLVMCSCCYDRIKTTPTGLPAAG